LLCHAPFVSIGSIPIVLVVFIARQQRSSGSMLIRDIDIANLSVPPSVCLSVRNVPVSDENGLTYRDSFFHHTVAQSF